MATAEVLDEQQKLSGIFDEGWKLFESLNITDEPTNSSTVQVKTLILLFVELLLKF